MRLHWQWGLWEQQRHEFFSKSLHVPLLLSRLRGPVNGRQGNTHKHTHTSSRVYVTSEDFRPALSVHFLQTTTLSTSCLTLTWHKHICLFLIFSLTQFRGRWRHSRALRFLPAKRLFFVATAAKCLSSGGTRCLSTVWSGLNLPFRCQSITKISIWRCADRDMNHSQTIPGAFRNLSSHNNVVP